MHHVLLVLSILCILLGLWFIAVAFLSRPHVLADVDVARARPRPRVSAQQLGLGHRLAARLLASRQRPKDEEFLFIEQYTRDVDATYVGSIAFATPGVVWVASAVLATPPLLELEQLLEHLERFTARVRSWRPGRRRERS
jgi:hypothetical protein